MRWIDRCFGALRRQGLSARTIVVDNGSTDATVATLRDVYPEVRLLAQDDNLGFGAANNLGMALALKDHATHVFLLNQDAWPTNDGIGRAIALLEAERSWGILSPLHLAADEQTLDTLFEQYLPSPQSIAQLERHGPFTTKFVNAAAWLLPRATVEQVGGFSPLFHHYGEDLDYVARLRYHGLQVAIDPGWHVVHDRDERPTGWRDNPGHQLRVMHTGLLQRLADPNQAALSRWVDGAAWMAGNVITGLRAGQLSVVPQALRTVADAVVDTPRRRRTRGEARYASAPFLSQQAHS